MTFDNLTWFVVFFKPDLYSSIGVVNWVHAYPSGVLGKGLGCMHRRVGTEQCILIILDIEGVKL